MQLELKLPWPPSVNKYWGHGRGRAWVKPEGERYRTKVWFIFRDSPYHDAWYGESECKGFQVHIEAFPPDRRRRDLDNLLKAPLDALENAGVYPDDSMIHDLRIQRCSQVEDGALKVTINAIGGQNE